MCAKQRKKEEVLYIYPLQIGMVRRTTGIKKKKTDERTGEKGVTEEAKRHVKQ